MLRWASESEAGSGAAGSEQPHANWIKSSVIWWPLRLEVSAGNTTDSAHGGGALIENDSPNVERRLGTDSGMLPGTWRSDLHAFTRPKGDIPWLLANRTPSRADTLHLLR